MSTAANAERGETELIIEGQRYVLRPSFENLVAAEEELGSLFALVERAGQGELLLSEIAALFWFCQHGPAPLPREEIGEAVVAIGLAGAAAPLKTMLGQILRGR